jgi:hypothetical protein
MRSLFLALVAIPVAVAAYSFMEGTVGYLGGTAVFRGVGYPGREYYNLEPKYRVYWQTSGCVVLGTEYLTHVPYNFAVMALATVFGPMRGTYHGPYPTRQEAGAVLRDSRETVGLEALYHEQLTPARDCQALAARYPPGGGEKDPKCAVFRDRTIVLGDEGMASLVDTETGNRYARYMGTR